MNQNRLIEIQAFPNPVNDDLTFERSVFKNEGIVQIYNETGQLLDLKKILAGEEQLIIHFQNYPKGVYFIEYTDKEIHQSIRIFR